MNAAMVRKMRYKTSACLAVAFVGSGVPWARGGFHGSVVTFLLTQNPEAAVAFYRDKLGFRFLRDDGFALVFDMNGIMLRIGKSKSFTPAQNTVLGWESRDIAETLHTLVARGIAFERYPNMGQNPDGICTFPNGDQVAWFKDPDGNVLSVSQHAAIP
jgi:catechol 2,3-dioxygenase-like lactoylglutathione lyase family enzyme